MRSVQVSKPNGPFEIVERKIPEPKEKSRTEDIRYAVLHSRSDSDRTHNMAVPAAT
jgi:hypothetical protein